MKIPLDYGKYYHIYNRGNNYENIFLVKEDYLHFLTIFDAFISPIAETFAWCLMKNHFHLLIRIRPIDEIGFLNSANSHAPLPEIKWKTYFPDKPDAQFAKKPIPYRQFKHLFNAYTRWFNIRHDRCGSLFEKNCERKLVDKQHYFSNLIVYLHNNPVKHGFVEQAIEYPWSSYLTIKSDKPTKLKREDAMGYFKNLENYEFQHTISNKENEKDIQDWIIE